MQRKILHIDMNNFYASVELLTRPDLRDKPVIVGGDRSERHGIVLAKNEIAKAFGIVTAETIYQAKQKCPQAIVLPPNREEYARYMNLSRQIYLEYTERMEPFGPDEAWLDVSTIERSGIEIAEEIRQRIKSELKLRVSIGVSWNKTFAKMGSDYKKPDAVTVISKENYQDLLWPLPVGRFLFVGEVSARKLQHIGIYTVGDLAQASSEILHNLLGKHGLSLNTNARGEDQSLVTTEEERGHQKSIGAMQTTDHDLYHLEEIQNVFLDLAREVSRRAKKAGLKGQTVSITIKFEDFTQFSRQRTSSFLIQEADTIYNIALSLFHQHFAVRHLGIRLLGISLEKVEDDSVPEQMSLFELKPPTPRSEKQREVDALLEEMQERFGKGSIGKGFKEFF